jgi:hypothetical protein
MLAGSAGNPLLYKPLKPSKSEIRLLELQPAQKLHDKIVCRLITTSITGDVDFLALSYIWGDPTINEKITVNCSKVSVPVNLAEALRHIRAVFLPSLVQGHDFTPRWISNTLRQVRSILPDHPGQNGTPVLRIWIDALCINQLDPQEKSEQLVNISHIYKSAKMVIGWLGLKDEHTDILIETIRDIDSAMPPSWGDPDDIEKNPHNHAPQHAWLPKVRHVWEAEPEEGQPVSPAWVAIRDLFQRPYFHRGWILEEVALARSPAFMIGTSIIPWMLVLRLTLCLEELKEKESDVFPPEMRAMMKGLPLGAVQTLLGDLQRRQAGNSKNSEQWY